jgi:integrase
MRYRKLKECYLKAQAANVKRTSYESIETRLRIYVDPFMKNRRLPLKPPALIDYKACLAKEQISQSYKREIYTNLACLLAYGQKVFGIPSYTKQVQNFRKEPKRPREFYTENQYEKLRKKVEGQNYKTLLDVLFYGGLRRGEAMALTPSDCKDGKITIDKTYTRRKITTPKTPASVRVVELPKTVAEELARFSNGMTEKARIFKSTSYSTLKRRLESAAEAAKVKKIRVHDLRHSHITNLLYEGFTPQGIAKRVGHADVETLLNTYAEYESQEDDRISRRLERDIKKKSRPIEIENVKFRSTNGSPKKP